MEREPMCRLRARWCCNSRVAVTSGPIAGPSDFFDGNGRRSVFFLPERALFLIKTTAALSAPEVELIRLSQDYGFVAVA
jgi:hypothetical protein